MKIYYSTALLVIFSITIPVYAQLIENSATRSKFDRDAFLDGKRNGAAIVKNQTERMDSSSSSLTVDRDIFLSGKRHGAAIVKNRTERMESSSSSLTVDRDIFLSGKRHGAAVLQKANTVVALERKRKVNSVFRNMKIHY